MMKKISKTKRFFEIIIGILIIFIVISLVFLIFNYGFNLFLNTNSILVWIVITILTALVVFYIIKFLVRKNFLKIKSGQVSEVELDY